MLYEKEQFWTDLYVDFITTMSVFKKINISSDEIVDFVVEKEYLDDDASNTYGEILVNTGRALDIVRSIINKGLENVQNGNQTAVINADDLRNIYLAFDPSGAKIKVFDFKDEKSKRFYEIFEYVIIRMYSYDDLYTLCEYLVYAYVDYLKLMPLDDLSIDYIWFLIQAMFIFKGFGPVMFPDKFEFWELFESLEKLKVDTQDLPYSEWAELPNFKLIVKAWEEASIHWVEKHAFRYK